MPGAWLARAPARSWHSQNSSPSYLWCRKACAHSRQSLTVRVVSRQARSKVRGQDHLISLTPVLHYLPKFSQTHVHWISNTTHPSHSLSPPSPALNLSQHQGLFQWVGSSHQVAKVLGLQHQSFQWKSGLIYFSYVKITISPSFKGFPGGSDGKASARNARDLGSIPGSGRSPGEGNGNPL